MKKIVVKIASLIIEIEYRYDYIFDRCKDYLSSNHDHIDFHVSASEDDISKLDNSYPIEIREFISIYRLISEQLTKFNRILIHGAAISYNNQGYLFLAPSGTGKSTHIKHLRDLNNNIDIINGDKPILDANGYIYGTPWAGKENWSKNVSYKLKSIIFLKRDVTNHVNILEPSKSLINILNESYKDTGVDSAIDILSKGLNDVSFYELYCTDSNEAAEVSFDNILKIA